MRRSVSIRPTSTDRLEALTDGTFAIVITLLVLEIHRPEAEPGDLGAELARAWPSYLAYAVAFVYVGVIWLNHHYVFSEVAYTDRTLHWINLGIIGTAALIPFPTGVVADAFAASNADDQRSAVLLYALIAFLMSAAWVPLFVYLGRNPWMLDERLPPRRFAIEIVRPAAGAASYVLAAVLGWFVAPAIAVLLFVLVVAYYAVTSAGMAAAGRRRHLPAPTSAAEPQG
jgi:uncharacterized membrane protein